MFEDSDQIVNTFFTQADQFVEKLKSQPVEEVDEQFPTYLSDWFKELVL